MKATLRHANDLLGSRIVSRDGPAGRAVDILIDQKRWSCRYLIVDIGHWLPGRQVLLSFETIEPFEEEGHDLYVGLTRDAIERSPDVSTQNPVSMEAELLLGKYRQWTPAGVSRLPDSVAHDIAAEATVPEKQEAEQDGESHWRSVREIEGYRIEASDGDIGHLKDILVEEGSWLIRYLVVNTGHWLFHRQVLLPLLALEEIRWADQRVQVSMLRAAIESSPGFDPQGPVARDYERALHAHYSRKPYWQLAEPAAMKPSPVH